MLCCRPPSEREGDRDSGGRSLRNQKDLMHAGSLSRLRRQLPPGGSPIGELRFWNLLPIAVVDTVKDVLGLL